MKEDNRLAFSGQRNFREQWQVNERIDLQASEQSWKWMEYMAIMAPQLRSRLLAPGIDPEGQQHVLPIGSSLHVALLDYEIERRRYLDPWDQRYLDALESGYDPGTADLVMRESRMTNWRRRKEREKQATSTNAA